MTTAQFELTVTDAVSNGVEQMIEKHGLDPARAGLRVGAYKGGCSGYMYDVRVEPEPADDDDILRINGVRIFVNDFSKPLITGMKVDWVSNFTEQRFTFTNPNATGECGCGVSFSVG